MKQVEFETYLSFSLYFPSTFTSSRTYQKFSGIYDKD